MGSYKLVEETDFAIDQTFKVWVLYKEEALVAEFYQLCLATKVLEFLNNLTRE